jgi:hypothetical protein
MLERKKNAQAQAHYKTHAQVHIKERNANRKKTPKMCVPISIKHIIREIKITR